MRSPTWVRRFTAWSRLPYVDPELPVELLPTDWPAPAARARFTGLARDAVRTSNAAPGLGRRRGRTSLNTNTGRRRHNGSAAASVYIDVTELAVGDGFEDFAVAELGGLLRYAVMLTGDRELARDLVQDVMLKAYTQWDRVAAADQAQSDRNGGSRHRSQVRPKAPPRRSPPAGREQGAGLAG